MLPLQITKMIVIILMLPIYITKMIVDKPHVV